MNQETLALFKSTPGAMSVTEGLALESIAAKAPPGTCVECGTHSGKSAIAIASGLNRGQILDLVDPDFKIPDEIIIAGVWSATLPAKVRAVLHHGYSHEWLPALHSLRGDFAFVFLDSGEHTYELCRSECDIVVPRMVKGGIIALHDYMSQFIGVEKCYREVLAAGGFEEIAIPWDSIVADESGNDSYHHPELEHPMFLGALRKL